MRQKPPKRSPRKVWRTPDVVRDWQQGETPLPTSENAADVGGLIDEIFSRLKLVDGIEEGNIRQSWQKVAGSFVAAQTEVVSLKRGTLLLRVLQPAMRFHLDQSRGDLLAKVQRELGKDSVREIRLISG